MTCLLFIQHIVILFTYIEHWSINLFFPRFSFLSAVIFTRYAQDEEAADDQEETGWKYIHGDVFRFPKFKSIFAAALGSGTQLFPSLLKLFFKGYKIERTQSFSINFFLCSTIFIFMLALVGVFYPYNRGALFTALVVIYALTSGIAGYTATSFYIQLEGTNWVHMNCLHYCLIVKWN
jgi:hypothetical protein